MEDKTIKVKAKVKVKIGIMKDKMDKIGMEGSMDLMGKGRDGQEIIQALMAKAGLEIMFQAIKGGITKDSNQGNRETNGKAE